MNLLVPCAGKSSRFRTQTPKYLLSMPDGRLMLEHAIAPFLSKADRVIVAILKDHDNSFEASSIINDILPNSEVVILDEVTRGPAETVLNMIRTSKVNGAFLVKDVDSFFEPEQNYDSSLNYVSVCNARDVRNVRLHNKSFAVVNEQGYLVGTVEKSIRSEFFSCGGYFFSDPEAFAESFSAYESLQVGGEFYLSSVIDVMIESGHVFQPMNCVKYEDWGTHEDWIAFRKRVATYLLDIDGVLYENGSRFGTPRWGENKIIGRARDKVNELYDDGNYVVLVTSRPETFRATTEMQLGRDNVQYHQLVMGVLHGTRVVVNDFSQTNPYPTALAINTSRNSGDFIDKI